MARPAANNVLKSPLVLNLHQLFRGTSQLNTPRRKLVPPAPCQRTRRTCFRGPWGGSFGVASPWYLLLPAFWPPSLPLPISSSLPVSPPPFALLDRPSACAVASPSDASLLPPWCLAIESNRSGSTRGPLVLEQRPLHCCVAPDPAVRILARASPEASFAATAPAALRLARERG
ncbi:hypothetical protein HDV63DRAFT_341692 [Trichoderma sp. SZMC 28014]